jgi:preprotein translocase subunit SecF
MIRLFEHANYDFLGARRIAYLVTAIVFVAGLISLFARGLNESVEFTGGTLIQIRAVDSTVTINRVRQALEAGGFADLELSTFGTDREFVARAGLRGGGLEDAEQTGRAVDAALTASLGAGTYSVERVEAIGPKVGAELRSRALLAIVLSFGGTLLYLTFRFEWRFAVAAIIATAHDIALTIAFISLLNREVTLVLVAAVLTIVGYSLNDTIVVFDRVRENLHKFKREKFAELLNRSVNETLPRTVLTGGTTLVATISLLIFGVSVIRDFAAVMTFGIIVGTFSSIFIASPVLLLIERRWPGEDVRGARALPERDASPTPARAD